MKLLCATYLVFFLMMGGGESPIDFFSKRSPVSFQPNTPPVELLSFTVFVLKNRTVKILWKTSKESNNAYFTVEHSSNAKDWEVLFQVKGAGNSQELLRYEGTDPEAFLGTSYYRLKQTDFDGTSSYSEIMELYIDPGKVMPLTVYPNPTRALLTIEGAPDELDSFSLYNQEGEPVTDKVKVLDRGDFRISLDIAQLPKGVYLLKTVSETVKVEKE